MNRIAFVVFTVHSLSLPKDSWLGADKAKHFFLGAFVQSAAFSGLRTVGVSRNASLVAASGVTIAAALGKELRDRSAQGTPSAKDVVWGLAGAAAISPALARTR